MDGTAFPEPDKIQERTEILRGSATAQVDSRWQLRFSLRSNAARTIRRAFPSGDTIFQNANWRPHLAYDDRPVGYATTDKRCRLICKGKVTWRT
jgi:hypothetical protein